MRERYKPSRRELTPLAQNEREMIISRDAYETRIAFLEEGRLAEYYYERNQESSIVGRIYKGRVVAVLPGLQAAFVDIGLSKSGFLHVRDLMTEAMTVEEFITAQRARKQEENMTEEEIAAWAEKEGNQREPRGFRQPIQKRLQKDQEIMVQVEKEAISTKGPRLTGQISLPGRLVVVIPGVQHTGVSHRIVDEKERQRLKKILDRVTPKGFGAIARTSAQAATEKQIKMEIRHLEKLWKEIKIKERKSQAPAVLYAEQGLLQRVARDLLTKEDRRIVIDSPIEARKLKQWLKSQLTALEPEIELYQDETSLFESLNLEAEIEKALRPKVWLKCGGYLIIEETEALVVVDVNTGRNVGKEHQDETILRTNLEAAQEIGRQLRLRDLGGIIVLDFIDMRHPRHKERVYQELARVLRRDRAKTSIRQMTDLGLIEMTRKRVRGSLLRTVCEPCPMCQGRGWIRSAQTMRLKLKRILERAQRLTKERSFILEVSPYWLHAVGEHELKQQAQQSQCKLEVQMKPELRVEEMRLVSKLTHVLVVGNE